MLNVNLESQRKYDLEDRLVKFAIMILDVVIYCQIRRQHKIWSIDYQKVELAPL